MGSAFVRDIVAAAGKSTVGQGMTGADRVLPNYETLERELDVLIAKATVNPKTDMLAANSATNTDQPAIVLNRAMIDRVSDLANKHPDAKIYICRFIKGDEVIQTYPSLDYNGVLTGENKANYQVEYMTKLGYNFTRGYSIQAIPARTSGRLRIEGKIVYVREYYFKGVKSETTASKVRYLAYDAKEVTGNSSEGFFAVYETPTLSTQGEEYDLQALYDKYETIANGALQAFGGSGTLNKNGRAQYGNSHYDPKIGTLTYNKMERYGIALGPILQNPDFRPDLTQPNGVNAKDMCYGTCVDVKIQLNGKTYYIPAIIIDVKAHTSPNGVIQTATDFLGNYAQESGKGSIVEWYTPQYKNGKNKSNGLNKFGRGGSVIIYRKEVFW